MESSSDIDVRGPIQKHGLLLLNAGVFGLAAVTWPLWTGSSDLPGIPWVSGLCQVPIWVDWFLLVLTAVSLIVPCGMKKYQRPSLALAALAWGGLLLLDQQRVQTWAWQFWLILLVYTFVREMDLSTVWRWLVVAIYFWSAISKLDRGFLDGHGQLLLEGLLNSIGQTTKFWTPAGRQFGALLMPLTEFGIALLLMVPRTRSWGWGCSIAMHVGLLFTLGAKGLGHEWGVLGWNLWFLMQNSLLWSSESARKEPLSRAGRILSAVLFTYPAMQFPGLCDHWPAWEVYCARPELVKLLVTPDQIDLLPHSLRSFVLPPEPFQELQVVRVEGWGFEQVRCPLYPQERYRLALMSAILSDVDEGWRIEIASSPNRLTGQRQEMTLQSREELEQHLEKFLVNTRPRFDHQGK